MVAYHWPVSATGSSAVAIPLMPYQPTSLTASFSCAAADRLGAKAGERVLLSTVSLDPDPTAPVLSGLRVAVDGTQLRVTSDGVPIAERALPAGGDCTWTLRSDPRHTRLLLDGAAVAEVNGDVRPCVTGVFTQADSVDGLDLRLVTDTRFQTTISPLKAVLAALCLVGLVGMLAALAKTDRRYRPLRSVARSRAGRWRRAWRPRPVDAAVTILLVVWALIGPMTVDDGYIFGIVTSRGPNGFIGNVYRWLNAPEAPFSWFYDIYHGWELAAPGPFASVPWMRVPSTLLGLVCWAMLSRLVLSRLGRFTARASVPWIAALAFATWWLPFNLGLRPEPWVAVGGLAVFCAVERAIATRRVVPLVVGLLVAGATAAVTPAGLLAFTPFLAALAPLIRLLRARTDLHRLPLAVVVVAAPAPALLLMFSGQSFAAVRESVRVRLLIGGGLPWYQEYERYVSLLTPAFFGGSLTLRTPVLLLLLGFLPLTLALFGGSWRLRGVATGPARRLVGTTAFSLMALTASPTKWPYHFGGLAGVGAAVLVLFVHASSRAGIRAVPGGTPGARTREAWALTAGLGGVTVVAALVLAGWNQWPYVSGLGITWSTVAPMLFGVPLAKLALVVGAVVVGALALTISWRRAGGRDGLGGRAPRLLPTPGAVALVLMAATVALNVYSFAKVAIRRPQSYTVGGSNVSSLSGHGCGLADDLLVEADPRSGLLPLAAGGATLSGFAPISASAPAAVPLEMAGQTLPGWRADANSAGALQTAWYRLDDAQRSGALPVVVTISGQRGPRSGLTAEFGRFVGAAVSTVGTVGLPDAAGSPGARDVRLLAPPGADVVRLAAVDGDADTDIRLSVSVPRVPRLTPMTTLLPPGTTAVLDWPVAFAFTCLRQAALPEGTAELPQWRVAPPISTESTANITYDPNFGGPFAGPATLVRQQRLPVYLRGDPILDIAGLYRWVPITPLEDLSPTITERTVAGWYRDGRASVPGLDAPG